MLDALRKDRDKSEFVAKFAEKSYLSWERSFDNLDSNDKVYLIKQLKVYFQISFLMKLLHLMIEIRLEMQINRKFQHLINEKNVAYKYYLKNNKSSQSVAMF